MDSGDEQAALLLSWNWNLDRFKFLANTSDEDAEDDWAWPAASAFDMTQFELIGAKFSESPEWSADVLAGDAE